MKKRKIPTRKCILTNEMFPKKDLLRIVKNKEGETIRQVESISRLEGFENNKYIITKIA